MRPGCGLGELLEYVSAFFLLCFQGFSAAQVSLLLKKDQEFCLALGSSLQNPGVNLGLPEGGRCSRLRRNEQVERQQEKRSDGSDVSHRLFAECLDEFAAKGGNIFDDTPPDLVAIPKGRLVNPLPASVHQIILDAQ